MTTFSREEIEQLRKYVSDPTGDIFLVQNMPGLAGAIFARYSRAHGGFREVLLREFLKEGEIDVKKADSLMERVLIAFGDESVGELEGTHLSLEGISNLATKMIEDRRIGGSPIEQSSRYVVYDHLDEQGNFRYYRDPQIMVSVHGSAFVEGMDTIFRTYTGLVAKISDFLKQLKPLEETTYAIKPGDQTQYRLADLNDDGEIKAFKQTYGFDIKSKACDTVRCLLPVATRTNVGIFGNGRFFQTMLTRLYSEDLPEMQDIAARAHTELNKIIPKFIKRAKRSEYFVGTRRNMRALAQKVLGDAPHEGKLEEVILLENGGDKTYIRDVVAQMLFAYSHVSLPELRRRVELLSGEQQQEIIRTYIGDRKTRFDRSGRALEVGYPLTFNLRGDFGMYRDLHRHRMLTQERQLLTPQYGFTLPAILHEAGCEAEVQHCVNISQTLWDKIAHDIGPEMAQYAVLFGFNIQFMMGMNIREAQHMFELRTGKQGHPAYRKMCQEMNREIMERYPQLATVTSFVDNNQYFWSRAESEARQRQKESALGETT